MSHRAHWTLHFPSSSSSSSGSISSHPTTLLARGGARTSSRSGSRAQRQYLEEQEYLRQNKEDFYRLIKEEQEAIAREMPSTFWGADSASARTSVKTFKAFFRAGMFSSSISVSINEIYASICQDGSQRRWIAILEPREWRNNSHSFAEPECLEMRASKS